MCPGTLDFIVPILQLYLGADIHQGRETAYGHAPQILILGFRQLTKQPLLTTQCRRGFGRLGQVPGDAGKPVFYVIQATALGEHLAFAVNTVHHLNKHAQMVRQGGSLPLLQFDTKATHALQFPGHGRQQRLIRRQSFHQGADIIRHRHKVTTASLRQGPNQRFQFFTQQTGHQPVQSRLGHLIQRSQRHDQGDAVALPGGIKAVFQRQAKPIEFKLIGKLIAAQIRASRKQETLIHEQRGFLFLAGLFVVPVHQPGDSVKVTGQARIVESHARFFIHQNVPTAQFMLHLFQCFKTLAIGFHKRRLSGQLPHDQAFTDHQLTGFFRLNGPIVNRPAAGQNQAEQIDLFLCHGAATLFRPVRLKILALEQVPRRLFDPQWIGFCHGPGKQPAGFHLLRRHQPARLGLRQ